ncbi:hypothetical protein A7X67_00310 [Clostridium sp. W14A]|nr:hypothetical protein A7X67_00310 [Clostridium sp. W14A]
MQRFTERGHFPYAPMMSDDRANDRINADFYCIRGKIGAGKRMKSRVNLHFGTMQMRVADKVQRLRPADRGADVQIIVG